MEWHKPGLGEVHNEDHSQMIYCEDADGIVDNELAEMVCELLNSEAQPAVEPVAWREQFASQVYADLAAADNQDVPLEEYPARILKVLDSIVGPRHPTIVQWRNDAIRNCASIAYKYCRDPESANFLKQDLEALLTATPTPAPNALDALTQAARQLGEWHEDDGPVAWWAWCGHEWAGEPAWIGTPNSSDWPGYHTHWTPHPEQPDAHGIGEKTP